MLVLHPEVRDAFQRGQPVVALESTLIAHGLPYPINLATAHAAEAAVRASGAIPATIAVLRGNATIGLTDAELESLAHASDVRKASRRDLAAALAEGATAATTVAATLFLAHKAGIRVFATGGIGGVHPVEADSAHDVSSDLYELARTPIAVVCAGAKSILDLGATLEVLETLSVPVIGFGTATFPAFYCTSSGLPLSTRHDHTEQTARLLRMHWALDGGGVLVAQPPPEADALPPEVFAAALAKAVAEAREAGVRGPRRTPYLLQRLALLTQGRTLRVNQSLIEANASLAGRLAVAFSREPDHASAGHW